MWQLLVKDLILQKKYFPQNIIIFVFMVILFSLSSNAIGIMLGSATFIFIYSFAMRAFYEDDKNNTLRLLVSLPLKKKTIVYARYFAVLVVNLVITLVFALAAVAMKNYNILLAPGEALAFLYSLPFYLSLYMILCAVFLPINFKLGYIKAASINRFIFMGFFIAIPVLLNFLKNLVPFQTFQNIISSLENIPYNLFMIILPIISLIVYLVSMVISVSFFHRRQIF